jgi:hypothetical protein
LIVLAKNNKAATIHRNLFVISVSSPRHFVNRANARHHTASVKDRCGRIAIPVAGGGYYRVGFPYANSPGMLAQQIAGVRVDG